MLRRDGGCARPGCDETRVERLHAHHLRHWLLGGRTDLTNLVLLCDRDHGLAHELDLALSRRGGQLIAVAPDGLRVWGPPDAAFAPGLPAGTDHAVTTLPATIMAVGGERMDLRYVVGVLMTNHELVHRLAEQNGLELAA